jgi:hypothetical protein
MRRTPDFKATQVFDWASEPSDERPTDFGRSTGYSQLSGYGSLPEVSGRAHRRQARRNGSGAMARAAVTVTLVLGLCTMALFTTVHYLRGL